MLPRELLNRSKLSSHSQTSVPLSLFRATFRPVDIPLYTGVSARLCRRASLHIHRVLYNLAGGWRPGEILVRLANYLNFHLHSTRRLQTNPRVRAISFCPTFRSAV